MIEQEGGGDQRSHAVSHQEDRLVRLPQADHRKVPAEHIGEISKALHINPPAIRPGVPEVIDGVNGVTVGYEVIDHIHVPAAVFGQSV